MTIVSVDIKTMFVIEFMCHNSSQIIKAGGTVLYPLFSGSCFMIQSEYVVRPLSNTDVLSLIIGISRFSLLVTRPIPAEPVNFSLLASLPVISRMDEIRPPYCAGMLLLYISASFTISELKAAKSRINGSGCRWFRHLAELDSGR